MTNFDAPDRVIDTLLEGGAIVFNSDLLTPDEREALEDCISRELDKFNLNPDIMPDRIKRLHSVLAKLSQLSY